MATVSAIIPTWNRADLLESILSNLAAQTRRPDQILVIDNGSTDASQSVAKKFGADVVAFPENRGFAVAVNEGITSATGEWLLILNNDVQLERDWLERLLATAVETDAPFAAGKLLQNGEAGMLDGSWDLVSRAAYAWRCGYGRPDATVWSTKRQISLAPMTAALFHRRVFDQIGLLDVRFESYYEDVDFGVRCCLAGIKGIYEPAAVALHMGKSSFGKQSYRVMYLSARNQVLLLAKHYPTATIRRFWWAILIGQILAVMAAAKHGHLFTALKGKWEGLRLWSIFREELAQQTASEAAITATIETVFSSSEQQILRLQNQIGFDPYWRLYFSLVRPS